MTPSPGFVGFNLCTDALTNPARHSKISITQNPRPNQSSEIRSGLNRRLRSQRSTSKVGVSILNLNDSVLSIACVFVFVLMALYASRRNFSRNLRPIATRWSGWALKDSKEVGELRVLISVCVANKNASGRGRVVRGHGECDLDDGLEGSY